MFTEQANLNSNNCKTEIDIVVSNKMPTRKYYYNGFTKTCNNCDLKKINNNNYENGNVKKHGLGLGSNNKTLRNGELNNVSPPLNTMPPPPPHKIVNNNNKSLLPINYNRRGYWKSGYTNGRSISPLGYDSDESCKSYSSKGNSIDEHHGKHKFFLIHS